MAKVIVTGWHEGLQKISMTKAIPAHTLLSLSGAKSVTDQVLDGESVEWVVESIQEAEVLLNRLKAIGAEAKIASE